MSKTHRASLLEAAKNYGEPHQMYVNFVAPEMVSLNATATAARFFDTEESARLEVRCTLTSTLVQDFLIPAMVKTEDSTLYDLDAHEASIGFVAVGLDSKESSVRVKLTLQDYQVFTDASNISSRSRRCDRKADEVYTALSQLEKTGDPSLDKLFGQWFMRASAEVRDQLNSILNDLGSERLPHVLLNFEVTSCPASEESKTNE